MPVLQHHKLFTWYVCVVRVCLFLCDVCTVSDDEGTTVRTTWQTDKRPNLWNVLPINVDDEKWIHALPEMLDLLRCLDISARLYDDDRR